MTSPTARLAAALAAGALAGALVTIAPLMPVAIGLALVTIACARRNLPDDERRAVTAVVVAALAVRALIVGWLAVASIPYASDQSGGLLFGDETYIFQKAIRTRNVLLGLPATKLDYLTMFEPYTRTRYATWMAWTQVMFGPSPYTTRLLNGTLFVAAAVALYRLARAAFGAVPAVCGLVAVVFLPSSVWWSVSLLKESAFFLLTTGALAGALVAIRARTTAARVAAGAACAASLWLVSDLRAGALVMTAGGIVLGLAIWWITARPVRIAAAAAAAIVAGIAFMYWSPLSSRGLRAMTVLAAQHAGNVSTPGHAYKTLDERFYPSFDMSIVAKPMTRGEAARFVARSTVTFVAAPLPWRSVGASELFYMPEQVAWYALIVLTLIGVPAAWQLDRLVASMLVGYAAPMAALLALVNGNVGTLVRLREMVLHYLVWIAALGFVVLIQRLVARGDVPTIVTS
jgi:hypothetical protein